MTPLELAWIGTMILQDEKEEDEEKINLIEYLASFTNPEAVKKIRYDRKNAIHTSDEDFRTLMKKISGRDVPEFQKKSKD